MDSEHGISRRHMLAMSAAAGGIAMVGGVPHARAQAAKKIEQLAPELEKIVATTEPIKDLADGFGGARSRRRTAVVEGRRLSAVQRHP